MAYSINGNGKYIPPKSTVITLNDNIFNDYEYDKTPLPKVDLLDELGYKRVEFSINGLDGILPLVLGGFGLLILVSIIKR